jgi:iron complex outermembrane recepter protein
VLGGNIFNVDGLGAPIAEQFRSPAAPLAGWIGVTYEFGVPKKFVGSVDND